MMQTFKKNWHSHLLGMLVFLLVFSLTDCRGLQISHSYDRGALATSAPIATDIGVQVFHEGGNAFDVAVAVGFVLAVVHPEAGNIGGGGFALIRDGETGQIKSLDFRETAPSAATEDMYLDSDGNVVDGLSTFGALACGVPGTVAGLYELWEQHGSLPWGNLVNIAATLADTGFVIDEYLANSFSEHRGQLTQFDETAAIFFRSGNDYKTGDRFIQKDLARTLHLIASKGKDGFYRGEVADTLVVCVHQHGGIITKSDLETYHTIWREPIHFTFDSLDIYSMPPPSSGGIAIGQILKLLEPYDLAPYTAKSPEFIHLFCEMSRLAFADRSEYLGDPEFYDIPSGLLDSTYLGSRRSTVKEDHASTSELIGPGAPPQKESDQTTHFSVCDAQGNMVSITYTLNSSYGCKLVVDGAGFLLNNEMDDFSVKPGVPNLYGLIGGEANKIEHGKRMLSSMSPTLVLHNNHPLLALGAPGGSKIITVVAQAIVNLTRFGLNLQEVVNTPRFHHQWLPDVLYLEENYFSAKIIKTLTRYGHNVKERSHYSDLQAVYFEPSGLITPASDPRNRGCSGGF